MAGGAPAPPPREAPHARYLVSQNVMCHCAGAWRDARIVGHNAGAGARKGADPLQKTCYNVLVNDGRNWVATEDDLQPVSLKPGHYVVTEASGFYPDRSVLPFVRRPRGGSQRRETMEAALPPVTLQKAELVCVPAPASGESTVLSDEEERSPLGGGVRTEEEAAVAALLPEPGLVFSGKVRVARVERGEARPLPREGWVAVSSLRECVKRAPERLDELVLLSPTPQRSSSLSPQQQRQQRQKQPARRRGERRRRADDEEYESPVRVRPAAGAGGGDFAGEGGAEAAVAEAAGYVSPIMRLMDSDVDDDELLHDEPVGGWGAVPVMPRVSTPPPFGGSDGWVGEAWVGDEGRRHRDVSPPQQLQARGRRGSGSGGRSRSGGGGGGVGREGRGARSASLQATIRRPRGAHEPQRPPLSAAATAKARAKAKGKPRMDFSSSPPSTRQHSKARLLSQGGGGGGGGGGGAGVRSRRSASASSSASAERTQRHSPEELRARAQDVLRDVAAPHGSVHGWSEHVLRESREGQLRAEQEAAAAEAAAARERARPQRGGRSRSRTGGGAAAATGECSSPRMRVAIGGGGSSGGASPVAAAAAAPAEAPRGMTLRSCRAMVHNSLAMHLMEEQVRRGATGRHREIVQKLYDNRKTPPAPEPRPARTGHERMHFGRVALEDSRPPALPVSRAKPSPNSPFRYAAKFVRGASESDETSPWMSPGAQTERQQSPAAAAAAAARHSPEDAATRAAPPHTKRQVRVASRSPQAPSAAATAAAAGDEPLAGKRGGSVSVAAETADRFALYAFVQPFLV